MRNFIISFLSIILYSCAVIKPKKQIEECNYKKYYYYYDNNTTINDSNKFIVFSEIKYGDDFNKSSLITIYTLFSNPNENKCLKYSLYFQNSDTLNFLNYEKQSIIFYSTQFNSNICMGNKLIFEIYDNCNLSKVKYEFDRKEGEQELLMGH